jgi:hypothetical protein
VGGMDFVLKMSQGAASRQSHENVVCSDDLFGILLSRLFTKENWFVLIWGI